MDRAAVQLARPRRAAASPRPTARPAPAPCCSVHVRVRPLNDLERDKGVAWRVESNGIFQVGRGCTCSPRAAVYCISLSAPP